MSDHVLKHTCSQSAVRGESCNNRAVNSSVQDISRSTIDRENWKIKKRKFSEELNIKKKGYDQANVGPM